MDEPTRPIRLRFHGGPMDGTEIDLDMTPQWIEGIRRGSTVRTYSHPGQREHRYTADTTRLTEPQADEDRVDIYHRPEPESPQ